MALGLISNGCCTIHPCHSLVSAIHNVDDGSGKLAWQHVLREANQVADAMAKCGFSIDSQFKIFYCPPSFISNALRADVARIWFPRGF